MTLLAPARGFQLSLETYGRTSGPYTVNLKVCTQMKDTAGAWNFVSIRSAIRAEHGGLTNRCDGRFVKVSRGSSNDTAHEKTQYDTAGLHNWTSESLTYDN